MSSIRRNNNGEIDFKTVPVSMPSLCIPRVFTNITEDRIRKIFQELKLGVISRIDIVPKQSEKNPNETVNRVFVHFVQWHQTDEATQVREKLLNNVEIQVTYDDKWYWKVSMCRPRQPQVVPTKKYKPTINLDFYSTTPPVTAFGSAAAPFGVAPFGVAPFGASPTGSIAPALDIAPALTIAQGLTIQLPTTIRTTFVPPQRFEPKSPTCPPPNRLSAPPPLPVLPPPSLPLPANDTNPDWVNVER